MTDWREPKLPKWPFYGGDLLLLTVAAWIVHQSPHPLGPWPLLCLVACTIAGAWVCVTPFLVEYRASIRFAESDSLNSVVEQIDNLQIFGNQISFATAQWQSVQEQSAKTIAAAKEIADRMSLEARAFGEFLQKSNDSEKSHLRLEVDKLRRSEGDWLQVVVRLLDHVYALHQAGLRSGQPKVREQLGQFQNACRDTARRLGLVPFEVQAGEPFNEKTHQLLDPADKPAAGARVAETIGAGYTFQGQFLRSAIVTLQTPTETDTGSEEPLLFGQPGQPAGEAPSVDVPQITPGPSAS